MFDAGGMRNHRLEIVMKKSIERAIEAQVAFGVLLMASKPDRKQIAEALLSVISTAEAASKDTGGIEVNLGHRNIIDRDPGTWSFLEGSVWRAMQNDDRFVGIFGLVDDFTKIHFGFRLLSPGEIKRRTAKKQKAVA